MFPICMFAQLFLQVYTPPYHLTESAHHILPSNKMSPQPHFISHLKAQRLSEELAVAQKKVDEYEDMCMLSSFVYVLPRLIN